ncbi:MAG: NnrS family protein [Pseudomonadota bacterium]
MKTFITIEEPPPPVAPRGFALWELGFRPFYLLASIFAALSIGLWAMQFAGWLGTPYLKGPAWHAHEMLFGFTLAVVTGFLFTAGRNWSGQPTPAGLPLAMLSLLWVAGRVLVLTPLGWTAAIVNTAFTLAVAAALAQPLVAAGNRRNYFFVALLLLMAAAQMAFHLAQLGVILWPAWAGMQLGLDAVLVIMAVMAGRVVPMFTNNGVPGAGARAHPVLEKVAMGLLLALLAADALTAPGGLKAALALAAAATHTARWLLWKPWKALGAPLVWVLHVAYAWIPVHLALRGFAEIGWIPASASIHALTVGAAGGLIIGMMTRTARGHTARPLRAGRLDVACYALLLAAGPVRVLLPLAAPGLTLHAVLASAALWSAGFALYAIGYWQVLTQPRLDGKPG